MAITTMGGAESGALPAIDFIKSGTGQQTEGQTYFHNPWYSVDGFPAQASAPSPGINGAALTSYTGQIPFFNPSSGNTYLYRVGMAQTAATAYVVLADRLWHNSGITVTTTTAQALTSATWPARDKNASTNGAGVMVGIEVSTATGNGSAVTTIAMEYTNSAGTTTRTATISDFPATAQVGTFIPFELAAGDSGVRSIQSITLGTTLTSGAIHLVAYRPFAQFPVNTNSIDYRGRAFAEFDVLQLGMPRLYDNTVPFMIAKVTTNTSWFQPRGFIQYTQG